MPRFTKLPVTIEAERFDHITTQPGTIGEKRVPVFDCDSGPRPEWLEQALLRHEKQDGAIFTVGDKLHVGTSEGLITASPGDWIIRGTSGEVYPCKPDVFEAVYRPADD